MAAKGTPWLYDAFPTAALLLVDPLEDAEVVADRLRNQRRDVSFVCAAAGAEHGIVTVNRHVEDSKSTLLGWRGERAKELVGYAEVSLRLLDDIAGSALGPIGLKIDVEGAAPDVLRGARETLTAHHPRIFLEIHEEGLEASGSGEAKSILESQSYEILEREGYWRCEPGDP